MSKTQHVVDGEASESDSDVEIAKSVSLDFSKNIEPYVISGEAEESDDESKISNRCTITEGDLPQHTATTPQTSPAKIYTSLLHQKLWECNVSMRATIEGLFKHTADISVEKLTRADKTLLSVQESMRATNANLTLAKARLKQLNAELEKANVSTALPTVKIRP